MANNNRSNIRGNLPEDDFAGEATELVAVDDFEFGDDPTSHIDTIGLQEDSFDGMKPEPTQTISVSEFGMARGKKSPRGVRRGQEPSVLIGDGRSINEGKFPPQRDASPIDSNFDKKFEEEFGGKTEFTEFSDLEDDEPAEHTRESPPPMGFHPRAPFPNGTDQATLAPTRQPIPAVTPQHPPKTHGATQQIRPEELGLPPVAPPTPRVPMSMAGHAKTDVDVVPETESTFVSSHPMGGPNLNAGSPIDDICNDPILSQNYKFAKESVQIGETALIFAQSLTGENVILKQVFAGDPAKMPAELQQRVQAISSIRHPQLISPRNMLATPTGGWAEFLRPPGFRLSDVISTNGPQPSEIVQKWVEEIGLVIKAIHANNVAYANLTPDAIWVQENGPLHLEPFDVLAFENRGQLGPYGPPELKVPHGQVHLSPASDVYSLAAVMFVTLTGLPFDPSKIEVLQEPSKTAIRKALTDNPAERLQTIDEFLSSFKKKGGLDRKQLLYIAAAIAVVGMFAVLFLPNENTPPPQRAESVEPAGEPENAVVAPPGPVQRFSVIKIATSYVLNPPKQAGAAADGGNSEKFESLDELLTKLQDNSTYQESEEGQKDAIAAVSKFHETNLGKPLNSNDWDTIQKYNFTGLAQKLQKEEAQKLNDALKEKNLQAFQENYQELAERDFGSVGAPLLERISSWEIVEIKGDQPTKNSGTKE